MSTRPYPSYKDSGVEWLGRIPVPWSAWPLKHLTQFVNGAPFKPTDWGSEGVPIIRIENLNGGEVFNRTTLAVNHRYEVQKGDILFGWSGNRGTSFGPFIWQKDGLFYLNQHIFRLEGFQAHRGWFYWMLKAVTLFVEQQAHGIIGLVHITKGDLGVIKIPLPSHDEQRAIASFLDREMAEIDALVKKKERLIELLQEKRTALISHAVTQGLNPNAPKKDSGIPWLGHIPKHWEVKRLAVIASKITNGFVGPTRDILVDEGIRYLQSLHIKNGQIRFDTPYYVRPEWSKAHAKSVLAEGDVLIVQTGDLGQCCAVPKEFEGVNCHALIIVRLRKGVGSGFFLSAFLRSHYGRASLRCCEEGATLPHLECGKIREISIALPPPQEQQAIVEHIDRETAKLDALMAKVLTAIERLQEYRTALISAAVTGQIDLRKEVE